MNHFFKLIRCLCLILVVSLFLNCASSSPKPKIFFIPSDFADLDSLKVNILETHRDSSNVFIQTYDKSNFPIDFAKLDNRALNVPKWAEKSLSSLVYYLIRNGKSELEAARLIFRWIAENISYDTESYFSGNVSPMTAEEVFNSRKSVCQGYADLFTKAASIAGLYATTISGWSKGAGYTVGDKISDKTNHAWNAVFIKGKWYLLDCTWASGYVDGPVFIKRFDDFYFLTPPEEFIYAHLPINPQMQLLKRPITKKEFENLPNLSPAFFENNLKIISHPYCSFEVDSNAVISLWAPEDVFFTVNLFVDGEKLSIIPSHYKIKREQNKVKISVNFPFKSKFILRIFVRKGNKQGYYGWALDYLVRARKVKKLLYTHDL